MADKEVKLLDVNVDEDEEDIQLLDVNVDEPEYLDVPVSDLERAQNASALRYHRRHTAPLPEGDAHVLQMPETNIEVMSDTLPAHGMPHVDPFAAMGSGMGVAMSSGDPGSSQRAMEEQVGPIAVDRLSYGHGEHILGEDAMADAEANKWHRDWLAVPGTDDWEEGPVVIDEPREGSEEIGMAMDAVTMLAPGAAIKAPRIAAKKGARALDDAAQMSLPIDELGTVGAGAKRAKKAANKAKKKKFMQRFQEAPEDLDDAGLLERVMRGSTISGLTGAAEAHGEGGDLSDMVIQGVPQALLGGLGEAAPLGRLYGSRGGRSIEKAAGELDGVPGGKFFGTGMSGVAATLAGAGKAGELMSSPLAPLMSSNFATDALRKLMPGVIPEPLYQTRRTYPSDEEIGAVVVTHTPDDPDDPWEEDLNIDRIEEEAAEAHPLTKLTTAEVSGYAPGDSEYAARAVYESGSLRPDSKELLLEAINSGDDMKIAQTAYKLSFTDPAFDQEWREVLEDLVEGGN